MERHLLIELSRNSESEVLVCFLSVLLMACYWVVACSPEVSKPKVVVLRIALVCIEGSICAFPSCLTLVSLRITLVRETPTEMSSLPPDNTLGVQCFGVKWVHCKGNICLL